MYNAENKLLKEEKLSVLADNSKLEFWTKKREASYSIFALKFNANYNKDGIIFSSTSKSIDKKNSVLTVIEFDENMKPGFTAEYNIPLLKWRHYAKSLMGKVYNDAYTEARVLDLMDDKHGFIYALVQSANPGNANDENLFWLYQFKKSDKNYMKVYRKEIMGNMMPDVVKLYRTNEGNMYVTATGFESDKNEINDLEKVNRYYISSFNSGGNLEKLLGQTLSMDLLELFDGASVKRQKKDEYILALKLENFHVNPDGSMFITWQQKYSESMAGNSQSHTYIFSGNALVQYFSSTKKLLWEQPIYKLQEGKNLSLNTYDGMRFFYHDNKLLILYPDEKRNATKDIKDKKIEKYSLVKLANKDLTGLFILSFNHKGFVKRNYFSWPKDRQGFAMNMHSIKQVTDNKFIGTASRLKQGMFNVVEEDYSVFTVGIE